MTAKPMTWERLQDYLKLRGEVAELERGKVVHVRDTVRGSSRHFPYQERTFAIAGTITKRAARLSTKRRELEAEKAAIEAFIDQNGDNQMSDMIAWRYLAGMTWGDVAKMAGGGNTADGVRKAVKRFFERE